MNLERAEFGEIRPDVPLPTSEKEVTKFIRDRTRLYFTTWVHPLIDALIENDTATLKRMTEGGV